MAICALGTVRAAEETVLRPGHGVVFSRLATVTSGESVLTHTFAIPYLKIPKIKFDHTVCTVYLNMHLHQDEYCHKLKNVLDMIIDQHNTMVGRISRNVNLIKELIPTKVEVVTHGQKGRFFPS